MYAASRSARDQLLGGPDAFPPRRLPFFTEYIGPQIGRISACRSAAAAPRNPAAHLCAAAPCRRFFPLSGRSIFSVAALPLRRPFIFIELPQNSATTAAA